MSELKFYELCQNNSGGSFHVDDKVCHRLFIEASSDDDATDIALDLGVYFNGCDTGQDCSCCGDRWYGVHEVDINNLSKNPYTVYIWDHVKDAESEWNRKYGNYKMVSKPEWKIAFGDTKKYEGSVVFKSFEEYAQFVADEYGWTTPDVRIFYKNGEVKEIFSNKIK